MKSFLILNKENEIIGSYKALEKDETSSFRSYLACPPHAVHVELPEGISIEMAIAFGFDLKSILI